MSDADVKALGNSFEAWRMERAPDIPKSDAFERFAVEYIFLDADLSDDEISSGLLGGGGDGGIDGMYFFINRRLMVDETDIPKDIITVDLHFVQASTESGFAESRIQKFQSFIDDLLAFSKPVDSFQYYSQKVRDAMLRFRDLYLEAAKKPHTFTVTFWYASRSDQAPNHSVLKRRDDLVARTKDHVTSANVRFEFWGAREILHAFRNPPNRTVALDIRCALHAGRWVDHMFGPTGPFC